MSFAERSALWCTGLLPVLVLGALVARGRWRRCWAFPLYLASVAAFNLVTAACGANLFEWSTWLAAELVQGSLALAAAMEITLRTFAKLPRGLQTARAALLFSLVGAGMLTWSAEAAAAHTLPDFAASLVPRFDLAAVAAFIGLLAVALFYDVPLDTLHTAIAHGLATYTALSAVGLQAVQELGWAARESVSWTLTMSYVALLIYWLAAAWRREAQVPASIVAGLWPWRR